MSGGLNKNSSPPPGPNYGWCHFFCRHVSVAFSLSGLEFMQWCVTRWVHILKSLSAYSCMCCFIWSLDAAVLIGWGLCALFTQLAPVIQLWNGSTIAALNSFSRLQLPGYDVSCMLGLLNQIYYHDAHTKLLFKYHTICIFWRLVRGSILFIFW